jgi:DNA (cytosine-5)-methyltransferase 1
MTYDAEVVDLFAGPGGWSEACKALCVDELGIEFDAAACATRAAAGHRTVHADLSTLNPSDFACRGFIASPPCQAFSTAGKGKGRDLIPDLLDAIHRRDWTARPDPDPKVWLVLEVGRWVDVLRPEWIALEQVPGVLPLWRAYAEWLRECGYSVWAGVLCAADFGVPQTRERAILIASRVRPVQPPEPTHGEAPVAGLFGTLERWVSMAEAIGWGMIERPSLTLRSAAGDGSLGAGGSGARASIRRELDEGRWTVNTGRRWVKGGDRDDAQTIDAADTPAPAVTAKSGGQWWINRPSTTLAGDPRCFPPGGHIANDGRDNSKMVGRSENTIRLTIRDALILQSFRPNYPVQGGKTKQFEQIGNAIPPRMATAILRSLV